MVARCRSKEKGKNSRRAYKSKSRVKKGKLKCSYRNKSSHFKKDCWKRKPSKEGSSKECSTNEANGAEISSGMVDEVLFFSNVSQYHHD